MKRYWEDRIVEALTVNGIAPEQARKIVNGVIDDAIEDETADAYQRGLEAERSVHFG